MTLVLSGCNSFCNYNFVLEQKTGEEEKEKGI